MDLGSGFPGDALQLGITGKREMLWQGEPGRPLQTERKKDLVL